MKKAFLFLFFIVSMPLFAEMKLLMFAGSTRVESYNKKLIAEAAEIAKTMGVSVTMIDLKDFPMPFYDADLEREEGMPEKAKELRKLMLDHDAIAIASPEYNQSIPAVLKNALDWISRTEDGRASKDFHGKRFAIMSASPGKKGGARALIHLRTILADIGGEVIEEEVSIPQAHNYFAKKNHPENLALKMELQQLLPTLVSP